MAAKTDMAAKATVAAEAVAIADVSKVTAWKIFLTMDNIHIFIQLKKDRKAKIANTAKSVNSSVILCVRGFNAC